MENHRLDQDYIKESDKLKRKSFRVVGLALGGVNTAGGILISLYILILKEEWGFSAYFIPFMMAIVGLGTLMIGRMNISEKTKLRLYSVNYLLIPFNLYIFADEAAEPFWVLTFLYVTLAFALQNRWLVSASILASLAGLLFIAIISPPEVIRIVGQEEHLLRVILFIIFVSYVLWGIGVSKKKETLLFQYMNHAENMAYENALLKMPNQIDFHLYVDYALRDSEMIIAKIEINDFQSVYDVLGQSKSEELLQMVKKRLMDKLDGMFFLAKGEGGQFLAAVKISDGSCEVDTLLRSLLHELSVSYALKESDYILVMNIGIADSQLDGRSSDELMRNAQFALNKAKELGMNRMVYCTTDLKQSSLEKIKISDSLYQSDLEEEFHLAYQPQLNLKTEKMTGVEALVRWNQPDIGPISPGIFIDIAEKNGFIVTLGRWILRKACKDIQELNETLDEPVKLAVNVSVVEVQQYDFVENVLAILHDTGLPPALLELELTERAFLENQAEDLMKITTLQSYGISMAIDDFGTGYSSFEVLKKIKIDKVKIPREFIDQVDEDLSNQRIVETIISMANRFGVSCLAEGIERQEENDVLVDYGCQEVQGYYYSKPVRLDAIKVKFLV